MASTMNSQTWLQNQTKIVKTVYSNSAPFKKQKYPMVFNDYEGDPERRFVQYLSMVGFGTFAPLSEGEVPALDVAKEGILANFVYNTYGLRYRVTEEGMEEDVRKIFPKLPGLLRYSGDITKEYILWNIFNFAFSSSVLWADGQPLCSTTHPLQGVPGGTYSNSLGGVPLTVETLNDMFQLVATIPDDRGLPAYRNLHNLLYPPRLHSQAQEVLKSGYYPKSDSNSINPVADTLDLMPIEYLTTPTNGPIPWFGLAAKGEPGEDAHTAFATIKWTRQDSYIEQGTNAFVHQARFRMANGIIDARGIVGSSGG